MTTIERKIHFGRGSRSQKALRRGRAEQAHPVGRVPRVSRLMALAIRLEQLIREGTVVDQAELARLGHVTRARLTLIMNLLSLPPETQEALLFLPASDRGRDSVTERELRPSSWKRQRKMRVNLGR